MLYSKSLSCQGVRYYKVCMCSSLYTLWGLVQVTLLSHSGWLLSRMLPCIKVHSKLTLSKYRIVTDGGRTMVSCPCSGPINIKWVMSMTGWMYESKRS
jgi:hypothetical protein